MKLSYGMIGESEYKKALDENVWAEALVMWLLGQRR